MRRALVIAALTLAAAAPASFGLLGNASFGRDVPVRVPSSAILLDERGSDVQPAADRTPLVATSTSPRLALSSSPAPTTRELHHGRTTSIGTTTTGPPTTPRAEPGDDNGGTALRSMTRSEAGDDHPVTTATTGTAEIGDDNSGRITESTARTRAGDDRAATATDSSRVEPGDDDSGRTTESTAPTRAGDDDAATTATARVRSGDDKGGDIHSPASESRHDGGDDGSGKRDGKG